VAPLLLAAAGLTALAAAAVVLRGFGPGYRVGRLLAAVPQVSIAEARRLAESGRPSYVRVDGRIDSEAEFEDADHRPLVLRRISLEWQRPDGTGPWTAIDTGVEAVPFVVREGLEEIGVAAGDLAEGLVVVPREARGRAADLGDAAPTGIAPDALVRRRIEHVSTVEHATILGVPVRGDDGQVTIRAGLGRPLILSTLERDEAMRVLGGGAIGRSRLAVACLGAGAVLLAAAALWWLGEALLGPGVSAALAASPDPTFRAGSDTRTPGENPGFVGEPLLAIAAVVVVGLLSLGATLAWIWLTGGPRKPQNAAKGPRGPRSNTPRR